MIQDTYEAYRLDKDKLEEYLQNLFPGVTISVRVRLKPHAPPADCHIRLTGDDGQLANDMYTFSIPRRLDANEREQILDLRW
ncbi:hypothetical protein BFW01_g8569 [Lasiodiplodia theobromae]|nr:hypothetical protein BFW01_g8569 [Lasiodiplodia theobromae]